MKDTFCKNKMMGQVFKFADMPTCCTPKKQRLVADSSVSGGANQEPEEKKLK